jgi:superfamily II DNA/RNA helicase
MSTPPVGQARTTARRRPARTFTPRSSTPRTSPARPARARAVPRRPEQDELDRLLDLAQQAGEPACTTFEALGLPRPLVAALARQAITTPFAIQSRALPDALAGRDVLGRAQTGSGKTLAFGLPLLSRLAECAVRTSGAPRGLVLVPTRELAQQVADALTPLGTALGMRLTTVFGGVPYGRQLAAMHRGVDVVVATPGRLVDLIERGACRLDRVEMTVVDEADYMADLGFLPVVTKLLEMTPNGGQRLLFSATLDRGVAGLVTRFLSEPAVHAVAPAASPVESADHRVFTVSREHKVAVAAEVAGRPGRTLFFVRTKHGVDRLVTQLERSGVEAAAIHGNLGQGARQRALEAFASGRTRVLVATDVAARGIHVDDVDLVVHFDPPNDSKDYLHRSGRTARAGASGTVVALAHPDQVRTLARLHEGARVTPTVLRVAPGDEAVRELATSGSVVVQRARRAVRDERGVRRPRSARGERRPRR